MTACGLLSNTEIYIHHKQVFSKVLFGGDQLTAERARGAQRCRRNELLPEDQLKGLVPAAADWHAKQCLLQVLFEYHLVLTCSFAT